MTENRMINHTKKKLFPKAKLAREKMEAYQEKTFPYKIAIWSAGDKRHLEALRFMTKGTAQTYLDKHCIKRGLKYYRKAPFGKLDMQYEFTLREKY